MRTCPQCAHESIVRCELVVGGFRAYKRIERCRPNHTAFRVEVSADTNPMDLIADFFTPWVRKFRKNLKNYYDKQEPKILPF